MSYPMLAGMVVVQHYWWDERTRQGVTASVQFTPQTIGSTNNITPNLTDGAEKAWIKTRAWKVAPDPLTGYLAVPLTPNDDPDLTAFGGYVVAPDGETARTVAIPSTAGTTTVTTQMAAALAKLSPPISVTVGATVQTVWLTDVATISSPPSPPDSFFDADQTTAAIAAGILAHDDDTSAHPDIRTLIGNATIVDATTSTKGKAKLLGGTADSPTVPYSAITGAPTIPGDATTSAKGSVQLAGDLAGTAASPTVPGLAGKAAGTTPTATKTANYTATAGDYVLADVSGSSWTLTLPTTPADKTRVGAKVTAKSGTNVLNLAAGGAATFNTTGGPTSGTLTLLNQAIIWQYVASSNVWVGVSDDLSLAQLDSRYVASGGSAGVQTVTAADATVTIAGTSTAPTVAVGTIAESKVTNLVSDLAAKASTSSLAAVATAGTYTSLTGKPSIPAAYTDLTGTVPQSALPSVALTDFLGAVASQAAMLALTGQRGDWCTRTDLGTDWQLITDDPTQLANWRQHVYPASPVSSVNGRTGSVTGLAEAANVPPNARQVASGTGLSGGGDLTADRTLAVSYGTTSTTAAVGNDSRLSDTRTPTDATVTDAKVASGAAIAESKLSLASDAVAATASRRTLGTGAQQAAAGNDTRITGAAQKASNLSDLASAATARTNLGLAAVAASGSASDVTTGTLPDGVIPAAITRDAELPWFDVRAYGVVGNGRRVADAAITTGTAALSSTAAGFVSGDVGKQVKVAGAGTSGGLLTTTISSVSGGVATLAANASTTVTAAYATYGTDDTTALMSAMNAARMSNSRRGGCVYIPAGYRCLASTPISLYPAVSVVGGGWSYDDRYYNTSALIAAAGFTGTAILLQDPDGGTVTSPSGPDYSWHQGTVEKIAVIGVGPTGPHGINPGWNGEASTLRNISVYDCNSAIYLTSVQASATFEALSLFHNNIGLNCDGINGSVRVFGLSGDENVSLARLKGGISANLTIVGLKAENYTSGNGDPVVDVVDCDGGMLTILGGWCDASASKTRVVRLSKTGATTNYPRVAIMGLGANTTYYTKMIDDTIGGGSASVSLGALSRGTYYWNMNSISGGQGGFMVAYGSRIYGQLDDGSSAAMMTMDTDDKVKINATFAGGRLVNGSVADVLSWAGGSSVQLGFYGTAPQSKPTVTGSKGGNAALGSLITALSTLGLITDTTT